MKRFIRLTVLLLVVLPPFFLPGFYFGNRSGSTLQEPLNNGLQGQLPLYVLREPAGLLMSTVEFLLIICREARVFLSQW